MPFPLSRRIEVEEMLVKKFVSTAVEHGWQPFTTLDGECGYETDTIDAVMEHAFDTDEVQVILRKDGERAWFRFVYGNDGWDVLNDYTLNLDDVVTECEPLVDQYEKEAR